MEGNPQDLHTCLACSPPSYRTARTLTFSRFVVSKRAEAGAPREGEVNNFDVLLLDAKAAREVKPRRVAAGRAWLEKRAANEVGSALETGRVQRGRERVKSTILNIGVYVD